MKKYLFIVLTLAIGLGLSLGDISLVKAQGTAPEEEFTLEEITVTAQKREQALQKVATTVEAISGDVLTQMGSKDLQDALKNMSNVLVSPVGEEMTVVIRGMDNDSMPGDSFSQVAVTVDGSFSNSWGVGTTGMYDMQRVEVLAGPQGTLYSRNSSGGVVNMISNDPNAKDALASGSVEMGNYSLVNFQGVINAPITDKLAIRGAFVSTLHDGYSDNGTNDQDDRSLRLKLGYYPTDTFSAILTYEYTKIGGKSQGNGYAPFEDQDDVEDPWHSNTNGDLFVANTQTNRWYMNMVWDTAIGSLTFLPSWSDTYRHEIQSGWIWSDGSFGMRSNDPTATHAGEGREHFVSPQDESSYELRMASKEDSFLTWVVGLYTYEREWNDKIYHEEYAYNGVQYPSTETTASWGTKGSKSEAAFGNLTFPVTDAFRLTGGIRYTKEDETQYGEARGPGVPPGTFVSSEYKSSHTDWKAAAEYDLGANSMLWADLSTGYKVVRGSSADQSLMSYQLGAKNRFLDNKLQLNATGFYYDYTNFDVGRVGSMYDTTTIPGETITYNGSGIGDATLYGLDLSTNYLLTSQDRVNFSLSYLHAAVEQVIITYTYQGQQSPMFPPVTVDAGKPLNNAPEWSIVLGYEHRFDLASGATITPAFNARYTSEYYLEFYPDQSNVPPGMDVNKVNTQTAHYTVDANINYSHYTGKWNFNAYIKNITNYAEKNGFMRGDLRLGYPMTYGGVLSVNF
jgi:iron complex outermembrane recepter protein